MIIRCSASTTRSRASDLVNTIKKVHANLNRDLKIIGLLRVMFDPGDPAAAGIDQLEGHFGDKGLPRHRAAQRAPGGGAQPRHAGGVRQGIKGARATWLLRTR